MTDETQEQRERRGHEAVEAVEARAVLGQCLQCGAGLEPLAEVYNAWQRRTCPRCGGMRSDWRGRSHAADADAATAERTADRTAAIGDRRHRAAARSSSKTGHPADEERAD